MLKHFAAIEGWNRMLEDNAAGASRTCP